MVLFQGYDDTAAVPKYFRFDFSDTPSETPRDIWMWGILVLLLFLGGFADFEIEPPTTFTRLALRSADDDDDDDPLQAMAAKRKPTIATPQTATKMVLVDGDLRQVTGESEPSGRGS